MLLGLLAITVCYVLVSEITKHWLFDPGKGKQHWWRAKRLGQNPPAAKSPETAG